MKTQSLAKNQKAFLYTVLCIILMLTLSGCRTVSGAEHDQIVKAAIDLADVQVAKGQYDAAVQTYNTARQAAPDYRLDYNCALVLSLDGRFQEAAELCAESFSHNSHIISLKTAQARYLRGAGQMELSYSAYLEALELNPYDTETRFQLIADYLEDENHKLAYEQALVLWNQGYMDKKTVDVLYAIEPELWQNVHSQLSR